MALPTPSITNDPAKRGRNRDHQKITAKGMAPTITRILPSRGDLLSVQKPTKIIAPGHKPMTAQRKPGNIAGIAHPEGDQHSDDQNKIRP